MRDFQLKKWFIILEPFPSENVTKSTGHLILKSFYRFTLSTFILHSHQLEAACYRETLNQRLHLIHEFQVIFCIPD